MVKISETEAHSEFLNLDSGSAMNLIVMVKISEAHSEFLNLECGIT